MAPEAPEAPEVPEAPATAEVPEGPESPAVPVRKKRRLTPYNVFIRDRYRLPEIQRLPVREGIRELARQWQESKSQ